MDPFIKLFVECVCFSFVLNLAHTFDDEFDAKKWHEIHRIHTPPLEHTPISVPIEVIIGFSVMAVLVLTCFIISCVCHRRHPEWFPTRPRTLSPLLPTGPPVTSGATTQGVYATFPVTTPAPVAPPQVYTLVPGAAPVMLYPQQTYYLQTNAPHPQGCVHASNTMAPPAQLLSAAPLPSQPAPRSRYGHANSKDISKVPLCHDW
ncbi:uncharacterized protein LOC142560407 [Dermacentor variabilis]|uniref:uncharacterized protein LOC142560407 n=1 Tax=Dermacentor variabilis TaxID=34621 RepID=UPI003F5B97FB